MGFLDSVGGTVLQTLEKPDIVENEQKINLKFEEFKEKIDLPFDEYHIKFTKKNCTPDYSLNQ